MKPFKFFLFISLLFSLIFSMHAAQDDRDLVNTLADLKLSCMHTASDDPDLETILRQLKEYTPFFPNESFPDLPTEEDFRQLESTLLRPGWQLPSSLKTYHLTLGNLEPFGISFPTIHRRVEENGKIISDLLYFIREGHERGVPYNTEETWIPFCEDGAEYVCMNLYTERVCYFSFIPRLKKDKSEYDNLSSWLKERLLSK